MFKKMSHPMLFVNDLERAVQFYQAKLGFSVMFHHPNAYASLFHKQMNCRLDLHPSEASSKDVGFGAMIYFESPDLLADVEKLKSMGVRVGEPKREGGSAFFVTFWDSEGNALGIQESR
jgi:predicted enzyme related to lactoylglutathione lyase